jgi:hypothetical protein
MFNPSSSLVSSSLALTALYALGLGGCEILSAENNNDKALQMMDRLAGIDWLINLSGSLYTVASRIRFVRPEKPTIYRQFTLRGDKYKDVKSEFTKRMDSINNGSLFPYLTMQCWISASQFVCGAMMKTKDLYSFIKEQPQVVMTNYSDRVFYSVNWEDVKTCEYPIIII